jgi:hypothetical protein
VSDLIKNIFRLAIFIIVQVFVLDKIPYLHRFIVPYIYYLFILWLPFSTPRMALLCIGFLTGLILDYFKMTPGLHAAACTLIAYARPFVITILSAKETSEFTFHEPSPRSMGFAPYMVYAFILTLLHHTYLVLLEWLQFGSFLSFLIKIGATTGISMLLIFTVELLFPRKLRYKTNVA